jgi:hypothetical protein
MITALQLIHKQSKSVDIIINIIIILTQLKLYLNDFKRITRSIQIID